jgi:hypothetical protein
MKLKVIKNGYFVVGDVVDTGLINQETFESSFVHFLWVGDVWVLKEEEDVKDVFECIEGEWEGEFNEGWWEFDNDTIKEYFEVLTND